VGTSRRFTGSQIISFQFFMATIRNLKWKLARRRRLLLQQAGLPAAGRPSRMHQGGAAPSAKPCFIIPLLHSISRFRCCPPVFSKIFPYEKPGGLHLHHVRGMTSLTGGSMIFGGHFLSAARQANAMRNLGAPAAKGFLVVPPHHIVIPSGKMT
jgi:hypothetical protein